jgi:hypothetical protein
MQHKTRPVRVGLVAGWGLALIALAGAIYLSADNQALRGELEQLREEPSEASAAAPGQAAEAGEEARQASLRAQQLEAERDSLHEKVASLEDQLAVVVAARDEAAAIAAEMPDDNEPKAAENPMAALFKGKKGKEFAMASASSAVNMQYGAFFSETGLAPEKEELVREILNRTFRDMIDLKFESIEGEELGPMMSALEEQQALDLQQVLSEEEYAEWEAYEETKQERMLRQSYDMQFGMMAGKIEQGTRELIVDVVVEEMVNGGAMDKPGGEDAEEMTAAFDRASTAYSNARERLVDTLTDQELAALDRFIEQQESVLEMMRQMMSKPGDDTEGEGAQQ